MNEISTYFIHLSIESLRPLYQQPIYFMKFHNIVFLIFVLQAYSLSAQTTKPNKDSADSSVNIPAPPTRGELHLTGVKKKPDFPGGKKAWHDFLRQHIDIRVPFANRAPPGVHQVMIRFIVGSDGKLRDIGADSNVGYGLESEVIRCFKKSQAWIPAEINDGTKVAFTLRQIITFTITNQDIIIRFLDP